MTSKSGKTYKYAVHGKKARDTLNQEEQELYDLCHLSGVEISPAVLRIILDLLKLNVTPLSIAQMLKSMIHQGHPKMDSSRSASGRGESSTRSGASSDSKGNSSARSASSKGESSTRERHRYEKAAKNRSNKVP